MRIKTTVIPVFDDYDEEFELYRIGRGKLMSMFEELENILEDSSPLGELLIETIDNLDKIISMTERDYKVDKD